MREILMRPQIYKFPNFKDFTADFPITDRDLILTNEYIYEPFIKGYEGDAKVIFQEKFGTSEPSEEMANAIWDAADPSTYDRIIAVGGGAIMDLGKVLSLKRNGTIHEIYFKKVDAEVEKDLIAIPTTAGTGSEVTNIAVLIVKDDKGQTTKLGLVSDLIIPNTVCLIPEFLKTLPYKPFASAAIDALIHAVESYLSPDRATMTSELFGVKAIELILEGFRRIDTEGEDARFGYLDEFQTASMYAGIAFLQAGCATVHAMSFPLGGVFHVPHGESNYALFGKVLEKYNKIDPDGKIADFKKLIALILGGTEDEALDRLAAIEEKILHLKPISEYGFTKENVKPFAESVLLNQQRLVTNSYVPLTKDLIEEIYTELVVE
ncbi:MAG: 4-hydroxybutyrate dehydrogenase [Clostridiales Family XIII bacterium]|nr:4-hydroxybutyrate dehydrogenase [Clostridiales Family XIII bacterium]